MRCKPDVLYVALVKKCAYDEIVIDGQDNKSGGISTAPSHRPPETKNPSSRSSPRGQLYTTVTVLHDVVDVVEQTVRSYVPAPLSPVE